MGAVNFKSKFISLHAMYDHCAGVGEGKACRGVAGSSDEAGGNELSHAGLRRSEIIQKQVFHGARLARALQHPETGEQRCQGLKHFSTVPGSPSSRDKQACLYRNAETVISKG